MGIRHACTEFAGLPVEDFDPDAGIADPTRVAVRISTTFEEWDTPGAFTAKFAAFLDDEQAADVRALIIGLWDGGAYDGESSAACVEQLVQAAGRLTGLRALFLGDIVQEEQEISWINQSDVSPLFAAYPDLEHFRVRGASGLAFGRLHHARLLSLIVESGGLPPPVVADVLNSEFPALEHLELWLGTPSYGGDCTPADLQPLLAGELFPRLKTLALRDSEIADEVAAALADAAILDRLETLDLSLGNLSDAGGAVLLASPRLGRLKKLDLHHHFLTKPLRARFEQLPLEVDVSQPQEPRNYGDREYRFVAASE